MVIYLGYEAISLPYGELLLVKLFVLMLSLPLVTQIKAPP